MYVGPKVFYLSAMFRITIFEVIAQTPVPVKKDNLKLFSESVTSAVQNSHQGTIVLAPMKRLFIIEKSKQVTKGPVYIWTFYESKRNCLVNHASVSLLV